MLAEDMYGSGMEQLITLFLSALLAATLLPVQSELVLAGLRYADSYPPEILLLVVTVGNVLGAVINWLLGRYIAHFEDKKWFPIKRKAIAKAEKFYEKWGVWSLLLAWLPFIGDPLTLIAGILRVRLSLFLLLVTIGKAGRYIVVLWLVPIGG